MTNIFYFVEKRADPSKFSWVHSNNKSYLLKNPLCPTPILVYKTRKQNWVIYICLSYLFLCNKTSAKLAAYVNKHVLFQCNSWWSGIQVVPAQNLQGMQLSKPGLQPSKGAGNPSPGSFMWLLSGALIFLILGPPTELRKQDSFAYTYWHQGKRSPKTETAVFLHLILETAYHHHC